MGWKQLGTVLAILTGSLAAFPGVGAQSSSTAPTVSTSCSGGVTDLAWAYAVDSDSRVTSDTDGWYYIELRDHSLWAESNRQAGLQLTARICREYDLVSGAFVRSYTLYPADSLLVDATPGIVVEYPTEPPAPPAGLPLSGWQLFPPSTGSGL